MSWSFPIARVLGTQVRIHVTFFLLLAWVGFVAYGNGGGASGALYGIGFILALFLCVLLHEFGHALAARAFGIQTPDITLLPIGGLARLERMPREPKQELIVAVAGPAVNVAIAVVLFLFLRVSTPFKELSFEAQSWTGFFVNLMAVNVWLVIFNLIPAFPMDGGRILRAALATRLSYGRATSVAATVGQALAFVGGFAGFLIPSPLLILIAFFVFMGAGAEASAAKEQEAAEDLSVRDAMMTRFQALKENDSIGKAVDLLLEGSQTDFPIVDDEGRLEGIAMRGDIIAALREHGEDAVIGYAKSECDRTVKVDVPLGDVLQDLRKSGARAFPVLDDSEELVGLLTLENVGEILMVKAALDARKSSTGPALGGVEPGQDSAGRELIERSQR